ncbi:hypothetical protein [Povalibacter sp.]|uniref:hypothetical protein n=1 Tax=Povalibacter sp. TaxID=1962978 RepID=UPI002F3F15E0
MATPEQQLVFATAVGSLDEHPQRWLPEDFVSSSLAQHAPLLAVAGPPQHRAAAADEELPALTGTGTSEPLSVITFSIVLRRIANTRR